MSPRRSLASLAFAFLLLCLASPAPAAAPDELVWRGDHATGRALMEDLAKEYAKGKMGKITLQPFSTVSGLDAVAQGSADFAGSARGKYARRAEEANLTFVPGALDAAVLITHPRNPVNSITLKQMHDIYLGRITNWKELGGEDKPINLYGIAASLDGVEYSLRQLVFGRGDQRVAAPRLYMNTSKLEEAISIDPAGLGLSTLAGTWTNKSVKALQVDGINASTASIVDGSYPLYIKLYLVTPANSPKQAAIDRFVEFLGTPTAKDILRRHQLVPISDVLDLAARETKRIDWFDAQLGRAPGTTAAIAAAEAAEAAPATAAAQPPTPVSAPRAMLESKVAVAPTAESTQAARENLARAEAKKAAEREAAANRAAVTSAAQATAATSAAAATSVAATTAPAKHATGAPSKAKVAKETKPAPKKTKMPAKADAQAAAPKAASFGNVSGGANGG
ncbi:hypothetical protein GCM10009105_22790 [Dokdonella soli]|uniref:PBP domain-containing protein n=2 Tax=Dokdonella soli TaxID=529810 RepID=A0ABN1IKU7_9GAMM